MKNQKMARYLRLVAWARARYVVAGTLIISTGGVPSTYSRIEALAFERYMRCPRDADGALVFGVI